MPGALGGRAVSANRLLDALIGQRLIGFCLADAAGVVLESRGAPEGLAVGEKLQDFVWLAGMWDAIEGLRLWGGALDLPSLGASAQGPARFDLRLAWLQEPRLYAALFSPADTRIGFEFKTAQAARENRLLLERVRQQQQQIEAQNALLRTFVERAPAAVAMLDADLNYVLASRRWVEDFNSPSADLAGQPFRNGVAAPVKRLEQAMRRKDRAARRGVEKLVTRQGGVEWHRWEQQPWDQPGFAPGGRIVFAERITRSVEQANRLRAQAKRLTALNEQMRAFALAASHDLRAPLRQIAAFSNFLNEDAGAEPQAREFARLIQQCAQRMTLMIEALLRYARVNYRETQASVFPIKRAVEAACANLSDDISRRGATVAIGAGPRVRADYALLVSLFQNLVDNALKHHGEGAPRIEVDFLVDDHAVTIRFADDGPGIPIERRAKAFELFQRLGASAATPGEGVGLALCRKIVELHGGEIEIEAGGGPGLRLIMRLPPQMAQRRRQGQRC